MPTPEEIEQAARDLGEAAADDVMDSGTYGKMSKEEQREAKNRNQNARNAKKRDSE